MRASSELQKNILTEIKSMFEQPRMQCREYNRVICHKRF